MRWMLLVTILISLNVYSHDGEHHIRDSNLLEIDENTPANIEFNFDLEIEDYLEKSDFEIVNYILMSSRNGDRWVTLTLQNTSSGQRIFKSKYLAAVIANGDVLYPYRINKKKFSGNEVETITLNFGRSIFPILYIVTRN